jgi:hypothetical protein
VCDEDTITDSSTISDSNTSRSTSSTSSDTPSCASSSGISAGSGSIMLASAEQEKEVVSLPDTLNFLAEFRDAAAALNQDETQEEDESLLFPSQATK